jgi:hypothetical protein
VHFLNIRNTPFYIEGATQSLKLYSLLYAGICSSELYNSIKL